MYYEQGKFKTKVRASFGYDENKKTIRRSKSFDNPAREGLTKYQYEKLIKKMALAIHEELVRDYEKEHHLKGLGINSGKFPTFSELADSWLDDRLYKNIHTINTNIDARKKLIRINPYLGSKPVDKIKAIDVNNALTSIAREKSQGNGKAGKELSGRTLLHYLSTIKTVLSFGVEMEILQQNVAKSVRPPKIRSSGRSPLTDDELMLILDTIANKEEFMYQIMYNLFARTGMRRGTLLGLKFSDFSRDGTISVRRAVVVNKDSKMLEEKGTKAETMHFVKIDMQLTEDIFKLKETYDKKTEEFGEAYHRSDYLFVNIDGTPLRPNSITQHTRRFREKYGLPYFTLHTFRHTYISAVAPIIGIEATAANTGHASKEGVAWYIAKNERANDEALNIIMGKIPPRPLENR